MSTHYILVISRLFYLFYFHSAIILENPMHLAASFNVDCINSDCSAMTLIYRSVSLCCVCLNVGAVLL